MSVELNPEELGFKSRSTVVGNGRELTTLGPFNHEVTQVLKITNTNSGPVAFKVRSCVLEIKIIMLTTMFR